MTVLFMMIITLVKFDVPTLVGLTAPGRGRMVARMAALSRLRRPRIGRSRVGGIRPMTPPPPTLGDSVGFATPIVGGSRRMRRSSRVGDRRRLARAGITVSVTSMGNGSRTGNGSVTSLGRIMARTRPRPRGVFSVIRRVPAFPKKGTRLVSFLTGGVGCPAVTRRGKARKHMVMRFIMRGSNSVTSTHITHKMSPCLSGRTLHIVGSVPR